MGILSKVLGGKRDKTSASASASAPAAAGASDQPPISGLAVNAAKSQSSVSPPTVASEPSNRLVAPNSEQQWQQLFTSKGKIAPQWLANPDWQQLEDHLVTVDFGPRLAQRLIADLRYGSGKGSHRQRLADLLLPWLRDVEVEFQLAEFSIILLLGSNGSGKTACAGKLAARLRQQQRKVLLVAADTFRSAAVSQLNIWAERAAVTIFNGKANEDPAAVVYKALAHARSAGFDTVIIDTAGRLANKQDLMAELAKINRIIGKQFPEQPQHTLMVLDAASGQNAVQQLQTFTKAVECNGLILTKLDGSSRGGIVVSLAEMSELPIYFLGTGEAIEDIIRFDAAKFLRLLLPHADDGNDKSI